MKALKSNCEISKKQNRSFPSVPIPFFHLITKTYDFHVLITVFLTVNKYADKQIINMNACNLEKETHKEINKTNAMW